MGAARRDSTAALPALRSLGTGAQQAAAGNHTHQTTAILSPFDPGSFSVVTGGFVIFADHITLSSSNTATLLGTSALRVT